MKKLLLLIAVLWALRPTAALAAEPLRFTGQISATEITLPYDFQIIDYSDSNAPPLPAIDFVDTALISQIGSIALTFFEIINVEIIGIALVLMLAVLAMFWLFSFVTDKPTAGISIRQPDIGVGVNDAVDIAYGAANAQIGYDARAQGRLMNDEVHGLIEAGFDTDSAFGWGDAQMRLKNQQFNDQRASLMSQKRQVSNYYRQGSAAWKRVRR